MPKRNIKIVMLTQHYGVKETLWASESFVFNCYFLTIRQLVVRVKFIIFCCLRHLFPKIMLVFNWFVTSKKWILQFTNLKCCIKPKSLLKLLFNGALVPIYYFKKHFKPCFMILKTFCSTLNSWIGEFVFWCHEQVK